MKALTVRQPWASAIFHGKVIENRTQNWAYRGPLAIHAGLRTDARGYDSPLVQEALTGRTGLGCWDTGIVTPRPFQTLGAVIGTVDLVDVHPDAGCCDPWGEHGTVDSPVPMYGPTGRTPRRITHLVLENPKLLDTPIPCAGALGLWTPPTDLIENLMEEGQWDSHGFA